MPGCRAVARGLVFGGGKLFNLTVAESVALPLCYRADLYRPPRGRGGAHAGTLGWITLPDGCHRRFRDLKAGGLARALMLRPDLLFLDNPWPG
jgi:ABC-type transporter Mla maintaining outer membrane lipid asymmetry ATPase subunit MlaF